METKKILVIDDHDDHRNAVQYLLKKENIDVLTARNGKTGLKLLKQHKDTQVIIVDIKMPDMSGIEVLKKIKDHPHPLRRIVLTAYDGKLPVEEAEELKVFAFLNKPVEKHSLLFTVKSAFNGLKKD
ncbi:MAG: response regulator [Candidatus Aminicenantes bacterium]|nr:response regulator [Candidatus Aminicenantes bacterium]